jgi:hypothetical protein
MLRLGLRVNARIYLIDFIEVPAPRSARSGALNNLFDIAPAAELRR